MIDWGLADRLARSVAGEEQAGRVARVGQDLVDECEELVTAYTRLAPTAPLPAAETVDRREWIAASLASMRGMLDPLGDRVAPGSGPLRGVAGAALGGQAGLITGVMARRVMGQYELALFDADAAPRLLFVAPNLASAAGELRARPDELVAWVALHEVTHAVQFGSVPWLRGHLAGLAGELLQTVEARVDAGALLRLPTAADIGRIVDAVRNADLVTLTTTPAQRELLGRLQAVMSLIEGHAEHVMDHAGPQLVPSLEQLRERLAVRRTQQPPLARILFRLLGIELKMRQYEEGRRFCDEVVAAAGIDGLNRAWDAPDLLPDGSEIADPSRWLARVGP